MQMRAAKAKLKELMPTKPRLDSSMKFLRFIPYRPAMKAPEPIPSVPMLNFRSRSMSEFRLASRIAFTLFRGQKGCCSSHFCKIRNDLGL